MAKRAHGEGSVYQLANGKWRGLVTAPGGRRLSKTAKTRKEVLDWVKKTTGQVERGLTYQAARVTLGEYLERWLASKESSIRPATFRHYQILVEKHLVPALGEILVKDLEPDRIQYTYDEWLKSGTGTHTVIKAHAVLSQVLERAKQNGLFASNPAEQVSPPKAPHKEMKFWTEEQANRFLASSQENRLYALFYLAVVMGPRQMELLGLQWQDLDWLKRTLKIRRQLARKNGERFAEIKTDAGRRTLELGTGTISVLRQHFERQQLERAIAGSSWQGHDLIFANRIGTPVHHKNLTDRYFRPLIKSAGVPAIRFHDLRHTAAAIMLSNGESIFKVSRILGHARQAITSDIYGHLVPGATSDIGQMMDDLVGPVAVQLVQGAEQVHKESE